MGGEDIYKSYVKHQSSEKKNEKISFHGSENVLNYRITTSYRKGYLTWKSGFRFGMVKFMDHQGEATCGALRHSEHIVLSNACSNSCW